MGELVVATTSAAFEQRVRRSFEGTLKGGLRRFTERDMHSMATAVRLEDVEGLPELLVLGPDVPMEVAMKVAARLDRDRPEISVVIVAPMSPELWREALQVGVRDVIDPQTLDQEMRTALEQAMDSAAHRRRALKAAQRERSCKVITVVAPKGGSGKTALASNIGAGLATRYPGRVVVIDLDLKFGDIAHVFGLAPEHTIADAAAVRDSLDLTTLKVFLTPWQEHLLALCAPETPAEGEEVSPLQVARILRLLAAEFDYVVIDTPAGISEHTISAIEMSTDLVLMTDLGLSSLHGVRSLVQALDRLDISAAPRHLVLNRADSRVGLDPREVPGVVGMPVAAEMPSTRALPLSMNQAIPVVESDPRAPISRRINDVIDLFATGPARDAQTSPGGFFRRVTSQRR